MLALTRGQRDQRSSEGLSDTGDLTSRGSPYSRGAITGLGTFLGGILHTLPFAALGAVR